MIHLDIPIWALFVAPAILAVLYAVYCIRHF